MTKPSLVEQVVNLATLVKSQQQQKMINDLKNNGLLHVPKFNLAYGPVSFTNQLNRR